MKSWPSFVLALALCVPSLTNAEPCDPNDPRLLKPNLKIMPPERARVVQREGARRLFFTTTIANVGRGPLRIDGKTIDAPGGGKVTQATQIISRSDGTTCEHVAGYFEFHATHNHFHLNDFVQYELRRDDPFTGPVAARAAKLSFCLTDIEPLRGFDGQRQVDADCAVQEGTQGISVGWADVYDDFYPEQLIELDIGRDDDPVPPGTYFLTNIPDPDNLILEVNESSTDKIGFVSVTVPQRVGNKPIPTASVAPSPPTPAVPTPTATVRPRPSIRPRPTPRPRPSRAPRPTRPRPGDPTPTLPQPSATSTVGGEPSPTPTATMIAPTATRPPVLTCPNQPSVCPQVPACKTRNRLGKTYFAYPGRDRVLTSSGFIRLNDLSDGFDPLNEGGSLALIDKNRNVVMQVPSLQFEQTGPNSFIGRSDQGELSISQFQNGYNFSFTLDDPGFPRDYFSVVFDLCLTIGDDGVYEQIVCQPKPNSGFLCHNNP